VLPQSTIFVSCNRCKDKIFGHYLRREEWGGERGEGEWGEREGRERGERERRERGEREERTRERREETIGHERRTRRGEDQIGVDAGHRDTISLCSKRALSPEFWQESILPTVQFNPVMSSPTIAAHG
jgi:hypothetical protein